MAQWIRAIFIHFNQRPWINQTWSFPGNFSEESGASRKQLGELHSVHFQRLARLVGGAESWSQQSYGHTKRVSERFEETDHFEIDN